MAIGELGAPSLDYVYYEMTWAEYRLRLFSFKRQRKATEMLVRELAWVTYVAPNQDPKKMKKSIKSFWPIDSKKAKGPTEKMLKVMKAAKEKYLKEKQDGREQQ